MGRSNQTEAATLLPPANGDPSGRSNEAMTWAWLLQGVTGSRPQNVTLSAPISLPLSSTAQLVR